MKAENIEATEDFAVIGPHLVHRHGWRRSLCFVKIDGVKCFRWYEFRETKTPRALDVFATSWAGAIVAMRFEFIGGMDRFDWEIAEESCGWAKKLFTMKM